MVIAAILLAVVVATGLGIVGFTVAIDSTATARIRIFGIVMAAAGIANLVLLFGAWRFKSAKLPHVTAYLAIIVVGIWTVGSFDNRILSGLEVLACLVVATAAAANWYSVRALVGRRGE